MFPAGKRPRLRLNRNGIFATAHSSHAAKTPFRFSRPLTVFASPAVNPGPVFWPFCPSTPKTAQNTGLP